MISIICSIIVLISHHLLPPDLSPPQEEMVDGSRVFDAFLTYIFEERQRGMVYRMQYSDEQHNNDKALSKGLVLSAFALFRFALNMYILSLHV